MTNRRNLTCALVALSASVLAAGCNNQPKGPTQATPEKASAMSEMGRRTGMARPKTTTIPGGGAMAPGGGSPAMSPAGMPPGGMAGRPPMGMPR